MKQFKAWGSCLDCNFEGMLEYSHLAGEDYSDSAVLGVMLQQRCPSCENSDHTLMPMEHYQELMAELRALENSQNG
jgi:hypothetical protein